METQPRVTMIRSGEVDALDLREWRNMSRYFTPRELRSKGNGDLLVNWDALKALNLLRQVWGGPLIVHSAYRDPLHNQSVGGARDSLHMQGRAFDIGVARWTDANVVLFVHWATYAGFRGFGLYLDRAVPFLHIDTGSARSWQTGQSRLDDTDDTTEVL